MVTRHHTKDKGDLAVLKVLADLGERGFGALLPVTEHAPFDLVAYGSGSFYRVQVKFRAASNGRVQVAFVSSWADRHGTHKRPMSRDEVDVIAIYCPDTRECYYVDPASCRESVSLRVEPARNGQAKGVLLAERYRLMPPASVPGVPGAAPTPGGATNPDARR